ncbi:uncharacterized protein LOC142349642 isoform X2 [Convolutriloba macropyga]|uniref:uncharacterized protein LOC142349642 isoform X2 n=1 Tax=Convolutriloba macropyga TaxID=536237 RepID=UPI003F51E64F
MTAAQSTKLTLLCLIVVTEMTLSYNNTRQTWSFILPDRESDLGSKCAVFSNYYCFSTYWTNYKHTERRETAYDITVFKQLIFPIYASINWFSFEAIAENRDVCCDHQAIVYGSRALPFGISPVEFLHIVTDYSVVQKSLYHVKVSACFKSCGAC